MPFPSEIFREYCVRQFCNDIEKQCRSVIWPVIPDPFHKDNNGADTSERKQDLILNLVTQLAVLYKYQTTCWICTGLAQHRAIVPGNNHDQPI